MHRSQVVDSHVHNETLCHILFMHISSNGCYTLELRQIFVCRTIYNTRQALAVNKQNETLRHILFMHISSNQRGRKRGGRGGSRPPTF